MINMVSLRRFIAGTLIIFSFIVFLLALLLVVMQGIDSESFMGLAVGFLLAIAGNYMSPSSTKEQKRQSKYIKSELLNFDLFALSSAGWLASYLAVFFLDLSHMFSILSFSQNIILKPEGILYLL